MTEAQQRIRLDENAIITRKLDSRGLEWRLYRRAADDDPPWRSLTLVAPPSDRKLRYHFGWDGKRLARNGDMGELRKRHRLMWEWLHDAVPSLIDQPET